MSKKPQQQRLIPMGPIDQLDREQRRRVQALWVANRAIPSGNRTAHNVTVMAEWILGPAPRGRRGGEHG